jgi:hypothetical protein
VRNSPTDSTDPTGHSAEGDDQANAQKESSAESESRIIQEAMQEVSQMSNAKVAALQQMSQLRIDLLNKETRLKNEVWDQEYMLEIIGLDEKNGFDMSTERQLALFTLSSLHLQIYGVMQAQSQVTSMMYLMTRSSQIVQLRLIGRIEQQSLAANMADLEMSYLLNQISLGNMSGLERQDNVQSQLRDAQQKAAEALREKMLQQEVNRENRLLPH